MTGTVIKIGGSQARHHALPALCNAIAEVAKSHPLLVVPGGGDFADAVRDYAGRFPLSDTAAHWMAILGMDQYGLLLADLIPGSHVVRALPGTEMATRTGVPVFLPHDWLRQSDPLPHSWDVTSDSIAAWIAGQANASRLVLIKDLDGLYNTEPTAQNAVFMERINTESLSGNNGVDKHLGKILKTAKYETWVINGQFPQRLVQLLEDGATLGTRVAGNG